MAIDRREVLTCPGLDPGTPSDNGGVKQKKERL